MQKGIFITGTDTGVGKTVIAGAIARALTSEGIDIGVMKPIETGCRRWKGKPLPADGSYLKTASRVQDPLELITPYCYPDPLAPWAASIRERTKINFKTIIKAYNRLRLMHSFLIVEGVGGLRVPLTADLDIVNLILLLDLPVLLVARSGLGTLNHTLLTLDQGSKHAVHFLGVILNQTTSKKTLADQTNPEILAKRIHLPFIGSFPYFKKRVTKEKNIEHSKTLLLRNSLMKEMLSSWTRS